ncbi:MAG: voltage-gated potassium channel [Bacteriovoracaceae bacterium]|jgi:voltage-gated potassium channel
MKSTWRDKLYVIIFEAETPKGKFFDLFLIWAILLSIGVICLESIKSVKADYGTLFFVLEWIFTGFFTIEYILRILSLKKPSSYIFSFYGIIDFLAIIPTFLGLIFVGTHSLMVIRAIRLLRIFRLLKLSRYIGEAEVLTKALLAGRHKITVFLLAVFSIALFMGAVMYVVEGEQNGFTSIPKGIYWAVVTMTTVGYGDLAPQTDFGRFLASILMVMGYGIIAVPTGIISVEIANVTKNQTTRTCSSCMLEGHTLDAVFCRACGAKL